MIRNPRLRRTVSIALLVFGGILMFLAPHNYWTGIVLVAGGVLLEIVGINIAHKDRR
jgi:drug/metabolite transporter (DMT)-like permease